MQSLKKIECNSLDKLYIDSIYSRLTEKENRIRRFLMSYIIDTKRPFNINLLEMENLKVLNLSKEELKKSLKNMQKKIALSMDEEGNVNFVYPVSAIKTKHKVSLEDGRAFCAMCAVDSIGSSFTFKQEVIIESNCTECNDKVLVKVKDGKIKDFLPKGLQILHVDLSKYKNWADSC